MNKLVYIVLASYILYSCSISKNINTGEKQERNENTKKYEYEYVFTEATKQKFLGNLNTALSLYQDCLKSNEKSGASLFEISTIYMTIGKNELAVDYAKKSVEYDPGNIWYKLNLAQLYYSNKQIDETVKIYEEILHIAPDNIEYKYNLAALYAENGDYKNSLKYFDEVESEVGVNESISLAKKDIYLKSNKLQQAYNELNKLILHYPEESKYYGVLAELYAQNNLNEKAKEMYDKIFELDKNNPVAQISYADFQRRNLNYEESFRTLKDVIKNENIRLETKVYTVMGYMQDEKEFKENKDKIGELIDELRKIYKDTINVEALYADYLIKNKQFVDAETQIRLLIKKNNNDYYLWEQLLFIESYLEEYSAMYEDSEKAKALFPEIPNVYFLNSIASIQLKNYNEALNSLKEGLPLINNNDNLTIQFYLYFAEAYNGLKDYRNSDKYFEKVLQLDPDNILVLNNYSYYLSERGENLDKAEEMSRKCIKKEPENSTYLDTYAWVLYKLGKYKEAKEVMEKALQFGGEQSEEIIEHYGDILYVTGNQNLAVTYWIKARELGRDTDELNEKINKKELIKK